MKISQKCSNLVKEFEGCSLVAYLCPAGVWTIGYGHTGLVDGAPVVAGMRISQEKAEALLEKDLEIFQRHVLSYNRIYHWTQPELDALVSFAFNVGNIHQLTSYGTCSKDVIAEKMLLYNKAGGKVLPGLTRRREAEARMFCSGKEGSYKAEEIKRDVAETEREEELLNSGLPCLADAVAVEILGRSISVPRILKDGANYVKLRDICRALGHDVSYENERIIID